MPGVSIQTAVRVGPNAATSVETSQMFAVGYAARGPVNAAKFVTSLEEFKERETFITLPCNSKHVFYEFCMKFWWKATILPLLQGTHHKDFA